MQSNVRLCDTAKANRQPVMLLFFSLFSKHEVTQYFKNKLEIDILRDTSTSAAKVFLYDVVEIKGFIYY